jgi:hypothetical protein
LIPSHQGGEMFFGALIHGARYNVQTGENQS